MKKVRTRIAPSPTGDPHVGTAYIALFNYCFAKQHGGDFILRIEDTDQVRSTTQSEKQIFDSLRWLGLDWSEGPDKGGSHAPYRQSERKDIYKQYAEKLVADGHAFYCFATSQELDDMRKQQEANNQTLKYDGRGLLLTPDQIKSNLDSGMPYVIRMKVPDTGDCVFNDLLRGTITIPWQQIDMQVLLKNDGFPTYFLANVVDDHLMEISHVIRGEEWLSSTPKITLLYQYLGWDEPVFCHMPLLRNTDKSKLSKRKNPTSIMLYKESGYTPEAVLNYLGRMGWSMPDGSEKFNLTDMINNFDLTRVSSGGPIFDINKMSWLNGVWIRDMSDGDFKQSLLDWSFTYNKIDSLDKIDYVDKLEKLAPLIKSRVEKFSDVENLIAFIFKEDLDFDIELLKHKTLDDNQVKDTLKKVLSGLKNIDTWNNDSILDSIKTQAGILNLKLKDVMPLLFVSITGSKSSISVIDAMDIIGPQKTIKRINSAIDKLSLFSQTVETKQKNRI